MDVATSPYGTSASDPNTQTLSMIRAILANQQTGNNQAGGGSGAQQAPAQQQPASVANTSSPGNPYGGAGNLIKGLINPPPTSILGQAKSALFGNGAGQSSGLAGAQPPSFGGPTLSNGQPANTYEGNINTTANPFSQSTGQFGMQPAQPPAPAPASNAVDPNSVPLPQPNPNGQTMWAGAQPMTNSSFNPAGVDPMAAALQQGSMAGMATAPGLTPLQPEIPV